MTAEAGPLAELKDAPSPGDLLRAKWLMDGATTLTDAAEALENQARWLRTLAGRGWTLASPIEDDYGTLVDPSGNDGHCADCGDLLGSTTRHDECLDEQD